MNDTITPGDNAVWNWSGVWSWTSTTQNNSNTKRIGRGLSDALTFGGELTNVANSMSGFRPVLLVEVFQINKFLIKQDSKYYSVKSEYYDQITKIFDSLSLTGITNPNKEDIEKLGFDSYDLLFNELTVDTETFRPIDKFNGNIELLYYKI